MHEFTKNTNEYAKEQIRNTPPLKERSIWMHWVDVTDEEIVAFFGVILNMGTIQHLKWTILLKNGHKKPLLRRCIK
jgi:hypothetical protein